MQTIEELWSDLFEMLKIPSSMNYSLAKIRGYFLKYWHYLQIFSESKSTYFHFIDSINVKI